MSARMFSRSLQTFKVRCPKSCTVTRNDKSVKDGPRRDRMVVPEDYSAAETLLALSELLDQLMS